MGKHCLLLVLIISFFLSGCDQQNELIGEGVLAGKVSIGPLCPVETNPPNPDCLPTEETYKAWPISVYTQNGKNHIVQLHPNLEGNYAVELPAGSYMVNLENQQPYGPGRSNLPVYIEIITDDTTRLNINIDTGIR